MRIGAFMISCAERAGVRAETLRNFAATDWNGAPTVVLDQGLHQRRQDRQTHTALCALRTALADGCDFILFLEDDLDFNRHLRHNLDCWPPLRAACTGAHFFASLYNPNVAALENHAGENCFVAHPESVYGSQAYLLARDTARYLVAHWDEIAGMQDIKMSRLAGRVCAIHYHAPSLVEHTGRQSVWGGGFHNAADFDRYWRANTVSPPYDREFFLNLRQGSLDSARAVAPLLLEVINPKRIIDVGCASGAWLAAFRELGAEDVWGIDGDCVEPDLLLIPEERVLRRDLTGDLNVGFESDLVICLEVAEHLPAFSADGFVASLARLGPVALFSAAIPGQGGYCHINEQWPEYWAERFARHGFQPIDCIRKRIWNDPSICFWYRQNILLFAHESYLAVHPALRAIGASAGLSLVHPELYLMKCR